jgi:hypothetical protein
MNEEGFEEKDKFEIMSTSLLEDDKNGVGVPFNGFTYEKQDNQSIAREDVGRVNDTMRFSNNSGGISINFRKF